MATLTRVGFIVQSKTGCIISTATTIEQARELLQKRLNDLRSAVIESQEIEATLEGMGVKSTASTPRPQRTAPAATRQAAKPKVANNGGKKRRGREPKRATHFVEIVTKMPGVTVSDVAKEMGIGPNYLYRVRDKLLKSGDLTTDAEKKLYPATAKDAATVPRVSEETDAGKDKTAAKTAAKTGTKKDSATVTA